MDRFETVERALDAIGRERVDKHGEPENSFDLIAQYWTVYVRKILADSLPSGTDISDFEIEPADVTEMMILLKIAREQNQHNPDNNVDKCGYSAITNELRYYSDYEECDCYEDEEEDEEEHIGECGYEPDRCRYCAFTEEEEENIGACGDQVDQVDQFANNIASRIAKGNEIKVLNKIAEGMERSGLYSDLDVEAVEGIIERLQEG